MNSFANDIEGWKGRLQNFFSEAADKETGVELVKKRRIQKIAIMLTAYYGYGGVFRGLRNIVKMVREGSRLAGDIVDIVVSVPENCYNLETDFDDLLELGVSIRETNWVVLSRDHINHAMHISNTHDVELHYPSYLLPDDKAGYFTDCDFWFLVSDRTTKPIAPLRPYGMLVYDYVQRYISNVLPHDFDFTPFIFSARGAAFVLSTVPFTLESVIQYAGVDPKRAFLTPLEVDIHVSRSEGQSAVVGKEYFVWSTNLSPHKNQINALKALHEYYSVHNGELYVVMTGVNTKLFDLKAPKIEQHKDPWIAEVRSLIEKSQFLRKKLIIVGELSDDDYMATLKNAKFLWHPCLVDAGTFCCVEAAFQNVPTLSHDYPAMRFYDERFALNMAFFNARRPKDAGRALKDMEQNIEARRAVLPPPEFLERFSWQSIAPEFWSKLHYLMETSV